MGQWGKRGNDNAPMARGWESKSVEAQQEDRAAQRVKAAPVSAEEAARRALVQRLEASRARVAADLTSATAPAHRRMLRAALADLDAQIERAQPPK